MLPVILFNINAGLIAAAMYASHWGVPAVLAWGVPMFIAGLIDGAVIAALLFRREPKGDLHGGFTPFA